MRAVSRSAVAITLVLVLTLGLQAAPGFGVRASVPLAGRASHLFPAGSARLYRLTAAQNTLQAVDPRSLADLPGPSLPLGPRRVMTDSPSIVVTADGSRYAVMYLHPTAHAPRGQDMTLQLFDARTGKPLSARVHPAVPMWLTGISADGSVVYGPSADSDPNLPCVTTPFYLLDTRTGRVVRHLTLAARPWDPVLVGPNLQRLYVMSSTDHLRGCGPRWSYSPTITAYDLQAGRPVQATRLKGVLAGSWMTKRTVNGEGVTADWRPGIALSPDGSQLAILDGHAGRLILLRAQSLRVAAVESLSRPRTMLERIAAALGLWPDRAEAKGQDNGVNLQMQYTADGRSLLLTGSRLRPDRRHLYGSSRPLGIRLVDIATGQVQAWLNDGRQTIAVWPAPDGSAVYSMVQDWSRAAGWFVTVRRHDPATLRVRASRIFHYVGNWSLDLVFLQARR